MTPISVPAAKQSPMDLYSADEKPPAYHDSHAHAHARDDDEAASGPCRPAPVAGYKHCHNGRLKRILVPALIAILALFGVGALMCVLGGHMADPGEMVEGLFHVKRAVDGDGSGSGSGSGTESSFTKHKLYLIVIFVGLLVVVILGVMAQRVVLQRRIREPLLLSLLSVRVLRWLSMSRMHRMRPVRRGRGPDVVRTAMRNERMWDDE